MQQPQEPFKYFGSELDLEEVEALALKIHPRYRDREPELYRTKWFDYRHLPPVKATYLFDHYYRLAVAQMYAKTKDAAKVSEIKPFEHEDIFKCKEMLAMCRARQSFDHIGVRYPWGLNWVMSRCADRGWGYFPRPNQLYGGELLADLEEAWTRHCKEVYQDVLHPRFTNPYYRGHPDQMDYHRWLIQQCKVRSLPHMLLSTLLQQQKIPMEVALSELGPETVQKARRLIFA